MNLLEVSSRLFHWDGSSIPTVGSTLDDPDRAPLPSPTTKTRNRARTHPESLGLGVSSVKMLPVETTPCHISLERAPFPTLPQAMRMLSLIESIDDQLTNDRNDRDKEPFRLYSIGSEAWAMM